MIDTLITTLLEEWVTDRRALHVRALEAKALERQQNLTASRREAGRKKAHNAGRNCEPRFPLPWGLPR